MLIEPAERASALPRNSYQHLDHTKFAAIFAAPPQAFAQKCQIRRAAYADLRCAFLCVNFSSHHVNSNCHNESLELSNCLLHSVATSIKRTFR